MNNKKGQFYLIAAVIIVALVLGYISISNSITKSNFQELKNPKEELRIEASNVLDYIVNNNLTSIQRKEKISNFTETYSNYSVAENLYFIYGDTSEIIVYSYRKKTPEIIQVNSGSGNVNMEIQPRDFTSSEHSPLGNEVILTIKEQEHFFDIKEGQNFYFILSQEDGGEEYIFTGNVVKEI